MGERKRKGWRRSRYAKPSRESWHSEVPGECDCRRVERWLRLVDTRCDWHRRLAEIEKFYLDNGWEVPNG